MSIWKDAIVKLTHLGFSIRSSDNNLCIKWRGKGNPPAEEDFSSLVQILRDHKSEILSDPYFYIQQTLRDISEVWQPGFLNFLKFSKPKEWGEVLAIEQEINECVLKNDLTRLQKTLNGYEELIKGIVKELKITDKQMELSFQENVCPQ